MSIPCSDGDKVTEGWGGVPHEGLFVESAKGQVGETCDGIRETTKGQVGVICDGQEGMVSHLIKSEVQDGGSCEGVRKEDSGLDSKESASPSQVNSKAGMYDGFNEDFHFYAKSKDILPANSAGYIEVCAPTKVLNGNAKFVLAKTCLINQPFLVGAALLDMKNLVLAVPYINLTQKPVQVPAGMLLARGSHIHESGIFDGSNDDPPDQALPVHHVRETMASSRKTKNIKEQFEDSATLIAPSTREGFVDLGDTTSKPNSEPKTQEEFDKRAKKLIDDGIKRSECPDSLQTRLRQLLCKFKDILADKDDKPGYCNLYQPSINLDTDVFIYQPQYPIPYQMRKIINDTVSKFLKDGIVQHFLRQPYDDLALIL
jgi:hypothetical protein